MESHKDGLAQSPVNGLGATNSNGLEIKAKRRRYKAMRKNASKNATRKIYERNKFGQEIKLHFD